MSAAPEEIEGLIEQLMASAKDFEYPPSIQSMANIRAINAMHNAAAALRARAHFDPGGRDRTMTATPEEIERLIERLESVISMFDDGINYDMTREDGSIVFFEDDYRKVLAALRARADAPAGRVGELEAELREAREYGDGITAKYKRQVHKIGPAIIARAEAAERKLEALVKAIEEELASWDPRALHDGNQLVAALSAAKSDAPAQKPESLPCITPDVQRAADAAWERIGGRPTDGQKGEEEAKNKTLDKP